MLGGMGTENGSWATMLADIRYWRKDQVKALAAGAIASINLEFGGTGSAAPSTQELGGTRTVHAGGAGFRYELARSFGIHAGMDVAWGPDETAIYFQTGSAWNRP